jgi:hypothetical protein
MSYVEADKVVLRLTRREVREVLLALASRTSTLTHELDLAETAIKSAVVADKVYVRLKRSAQTKWSGEAL